jgi:hypothetical protein
MNVNWVLLRGCPGLLRQYPVNIHLPAEVLVVPVVPVVTSRRARVPEETHYDPKA